MTSNALAIIAGLAGLLAVGANAAAQEADEVSSVSLISETTRVWPGQTLLLGLRFELEDGWHVYWDGRNDTGFPPTIDWTLPEGVSVGPMLWPAPHRHVSPGNILDHTYEGEPTILVPVTIGSSVVPGTTLRLEGEVEWLVCSEICLPGFGPVSIELSAVRMGNSSALELPKLSPEEAIGRAAAHLPQPVLPGGATEGVRLEWSDELVRVHAEGARELAFFPAMASTSLVSALQDAHAEGDTLALRLASEAEDLSKSEERRLVGVLEVRGDGDERRWYMIDYGANGWRKPANADTIARVRDRVERRPAQDP